MVRDSYQNLLINLGFEHDFYDDILKDFGSYSTRFAADLNEMNRFVVGRSLPPVVLMVVDQSPALDGKGHRISREVETAAARAGTPRSRETEQRAGSPRWLMAPLESRHVRGGSGKTSTGPRHR